MRYVFAALAQSGTASRLTGAAVRTPRQPPPQPRIELRDGGGPGGGHARPLGPRPRPRAGLVARLRLSGWTR